MAIERIVRTIQIGAPPEAVFELLAAPERAPEWSPSVRAVERLTPGPVRVGTETRSQVEALGRVWTARGRCLVCEPPNRIVVETRLGPGLVSRTDMQLVEQDGGTALRAELAFQMSGGPLGALIGSTIARQTLERDFDTSLERLKALRERN